MKNINDPNFYLLSPDRMSQGMDGGGQLDCLNRNTLLHTHAQLPMSQSTLLKQLIHFLQHDLSISPEAIAVARHEEAHLPHLLPMILWQYGLVSLEQLEQIFDWLDTTQARTGSL